jgi:hypothetical protein
MNLREQFADDGNEGQLPAACKATSGKCLTSPRKFRLMHTDFHRKCPFALNRARFIMRFSLGQVAQLVEHGPEKAGVAGSSPALST